MRNTDAPSTSDAGSPLTSVKKNPCGKVSVDRNSIFKIKNQTELFAYYFNFSLLEGDKKRL